MSNTKQEQRDPEGRLIQTDKNENQPLTGKPAGLKVDEVDDPGAVNAPQIAVEAAKSPSSTSVPEYKPPASRLPEQITARQIEADRSNPGRLCRQRGATMTIQRCTERRVSSTHDSNFTVSDAALATLMQGRFPPSHAVSCDCGESAGKIKPEDCENINIRDAEGNMVARFATKEFGAQRDSDGQIIVFRRPAGQTKKLTPTQDHARRIHQLNLEHEEFYRRGPA